MEVERGFESVTQWEGYASVKEKDLRDVLFQLVSDSDRHARSVEALLEMVRTSDDYLGIPLQPRTPSFKGRDDVEVMTEIAGVETLMFRLYTDIREALSGSDLPKLLVNGDDATAFIAALDGLIEDEARHVSIMSKYVRKLDRLR